MSNENSASVTKDKAIAVRESGDLATALNLFTELLKKSIANQTNEETVDLYGHIRIVYTRLAEESIEESQKLMYYKKAYDSIEKAHEVATKTKTSESSKVILQVHLATTTLDYARISPANSKTQLLEQSLSQINQAIPILPGSLAHKAWPMNVKANIQAELGLIHDAIKTINGGILNIYKGYEEEMKKDNNALMRINIWLTGLHLTFARICMERKRLGLANYYVNSVLNMPDPTNTLVERRKEATRVLKSSTHS